jgi:Leucine-rich repeat (LRR) protein
VPAKVKREHDAQAAKWESTIKTTTVSDRTGFLKTVLKKETFRKDSLDEAEAEPKAEYGSQAWRDQEWQQLLKKGRDDAKEKGEQEEAEKRRQRREAKLRKEAAARAKEAELAAWSNVYLCECVANGAAVTDPVLGKPIPLCDRVHLKASKVGGYDEGRDAVSVVTEMLSRGVALHQKVKIKFLNMIALGRITKVYADNIHADVELLSKVEMTVKNVPSFPLPAHVGDFWFGVNKYVFGRKGKQECLVRYEDQFHTAQPKMTRAHQRENYAVAELTQRVLVEAWPREPREVHMLQCIKMPKTLILPQPLLVTSPPGGGKSTLAMQLMHSICTAGITLKTTGLLPVLLPAASLAQWAMRADNFHEESFKLDQMSFFRLLEANKFGQHTIGVLWQARCDKRLLVLVDAVDELSGPSKPLVERFICKVLAREMKVVAFARDAGYDTKAFAFFQRVRLHGVSPPEQQLIIERTLARAVVDGSFDPAASARAVMAIVAERGDEALRTALQLPMHLLMLANVVAVTPRLDQWDASLASLYARVIDACVMTAVQRAEEVDKLAEETNAGTNLVGGAIVKKSKDPQRIRRRKALVRKALQQIALWVHGAHYVDGLSTIVAKGCDVANGVEVAAEEAKVADVCAKQTRQFTMSAARASGRIEEEALVELEHVLALPRRIVPAVEAGMVKGMFKGKKTEQWEEAEEGEEGKEEGSEEEYSEEEYSDDGSGEDEEMKKWEEIKKRRKITAERERLRLEKEGKVRAEREQLEKQLMAWQCPVSVLLAVPSTHSGCGLLDEAVLAFSHSSTHELLAAQAMDALLVEEHEEHDGRPAPANQVMAQLTLPPSPEQDFGGSEIGSSEEAKEPSFVSAFSSITRCAIMSKLMILLHHDILSKRRKLAQDEEDTQLLKSESDVARGMRRYATTAAVIRQRVVATSALRGEHGRVRFMGPCSQINNDDAELDIEGTHVGLYDPAATAALVSLLEGCAGGGDSVTSRLAVHTVNISGSRLLSRSMLPLLSSFGAGRLSGITSLDLSNNPGIGKRQLPEGWTTTKRAGVPFFLNFHDGSMVREHPGGQQVALQMMADALSNAGAPKLRVLKMRNTTLTGYGVADVCATEAECAESGQSKMGVLVNLLRALGPQLETLDISANHIGAEGLDTITNEEGGILRELPALRTLSLAENGLTDYGRTSSAIRSFGMLLEADANVLPSLTNVDLSGNMLCGAPAPVVTDAQAMRAFGRDDAFSLEGLKHLVEGICGTPAGTSAGLSPRASAGSTASWAPPPLAPPTAAAAPPPAPPPAAAPAGLAARSAAGSGPTRLQPPVKSHLLKPRGIMTLHIQDVTPAPQRKKKKKKKGKLITRHNYSGSEANPVPSMILARALNGDKKGNLAVDSDDEDHTEVDIASFRVSLTSFTCDTWMIRPGMQELVLRGIGLESLDVELLAAVIDGTWRFHALHTLDLSKNMIGKQTCGLSERDEIKGLQSLCLALRRGVLKKLLYFNIADNMITGEAAGQCISAAFTGLPELQKLVLAKNRFYHSGIDEIAREVANAPALKYLDISDNGLLGRFDARQSADFSGLTILFDAMKAGISKIAEIDLSSNCLGSDGLTELARMIQGVSKRWSLRLQNNFLISKERPAQSFPLMDTAGLVGLSETLAKDKRREIRAYTGNDSGIVALVDALIGADITQLDLSGNYLNSSAIEMFAAKIKQRRCETLQSLDLRNNGIAAEDKISLGRALMSVHTAASNGQIGSRTKRKQRRHSVIMKPTESRISDGQLCLHTIKTDSWSISDYHDAPFVPGVAEPPRPMTELQLSNAKLTGADATLLCGVLAGGAFGQTLHKLDLSHNDICDNEPRIHYENNLPAALIRVAIERERRPGMTKRQQDAADAAATAATAAIAAAAEGIEAALKAGEPAGVYNKYIQRQEEMAKKLKWAEAFTKGQRVEVALTNETTGRLKWYAAKVRYCRMDFNQDGPLYKYNVDYDYGDLGIKLVCKVLPALHTLGSLNLAGCGMHDKGANALLSALRNMHICPDMQQLNISESKATGVRFDPELKETFRDVCDNRKTFIRGVEADQADVSW